VLTTILHQEIESANLNSSPRNSLANGLHKADDYSQADGSHKADNINIAQQMVRIIANNYRAPAFCPLSNMGGFSVALK
jgi:hypothetical protein